MNNKDLMLKINSSFLREDLLNNLITNIANLKIDETKLEITDNECDNVYHYYYSIKRQAEFLQDVLILKQLKKVEHENNISNLLKY